MNRKVSVIGLGYVGLPVAVAFGKISRTVGFDINEKRIGQLMKGVDITGETDLGELMSTDILYTNNINDLHMADFHIVAVPTPVDDANQPDLSPIIKASELIGSIIKQGDIVVYESTVYPGVTEEICSPIIEKISGLKGGVDFKLGYSPERINPGDKEHRFTNIRKVVSGQDSTSLEIIAEVYGSVIKAGVHKAPSIKVAEASKVIENTQRDINIALMNELAILFDRMGVSTTDVLNAAATKWNFLNFKPGLVGGHCIGVDPYYLTHKAEKLGYIPQMILAGRRINDSMGKFIAQRTVKEMIRSGSNVVGSTVTILGLTFKEDCPDLRNSKVFDIYRELSDYGISVQVHDPLADPREAQKEYGIVLAKREELRKSDAIIVSVAHKEYKEMDMPCLASMMNNHPIIIDVKSIYNRKVAMQAGINIWQL